MSILRERIDHHWYWIEIKMADFLFHMPKWAAKALASVSGRRPEHTPSTAR